MIRVICSIILLGILLGCNSKKSVTNAVFTTLDGDSTGIVFSNKLTSSEQFNLFKYMYFYNGAGVGAGDFNNDGKTDLFFASNQGKNSLFLNRENLHFEDVTKAAGIPADGAWSTGVSVVDINQDGLLDMYICRVGKFEVLRSQNILLVNKGIGTNGIPTFVEESNAYGLAFAGFSTQAAFLDYDLDGDLDMYLMNHSIHQNGTFGQRAPLLATPSDVSGDRLYRNNGNNSFTDVTRESGINSSVLGYGLGISVADINLDGYPDIYIGNDFHENDYLYINQRYGKFADEAQLRTMHTSQYSMGVDVADANNDGFPEIVSMDMLPEDPYILKRSLGEDTYDLFNMKLSYGYHHQYTRNNLQYNRRNGVFSEIGLYAGIAATDWSWAPLWMDFDNDGMKDLFISNGIPKRMNDIDYINYITDRDVEDMVKGNKDAGSNMSLIDKFPQIKIPNKFYRNTGQLVFVDQEAAVSGNKGTYSNGAVYADFDNDGDLDIAVNNIDENVLLYRNNSSRSKDSGFLSLQLKGPAKNQNAVGARVLVYAGTDLQTYENNPAKGFLSSMVVPMHIGLGKSRIDSIKLIWPDNTVERIPSDWKSFHTVNYKPGLPIFNFKEITERLANPSPVFNDITAETGLLHKHKENSFVEFDRELLIPNMVSKEGPALAVADINGDGLDDVFIGSSKGEQSEVFLQNKAGKFYPLLQPALSVDSIYEDVDASWTDVNNDKFPDLVIASGGNEYYGNDDYLLPRVYLNDGKGMLTRKKDSFDKLYMTASRVTPNDFNGDGYTDLFIGGRAVPYAYGSIPSSYLLQNDGSGKFIDVTDKWSSELKRIGFITDAHWLDMNGDGDKDLLICSEWGGIDLFLTEKNHFTRKIISDRKGWWNFILPVDLNNDGKLDLVAGNLGLNSRLKATAEDPVKMYYYDFDGNGQKEQLLTYKVGGRELPFASKAELDKQMPALKKKYLYAEDFAKASIEELFKKDTLKKAALFTADYFANAILMNEGGLKFSLQSLPWEAQFSPFRSGIQIDPSGTTLLAGNFYENNVEMGRYDADYGTVLTMGKNKQPVINQLNGLRLKGQVRRIRNITVAGKRSFIYVANNDSTRIISIRKQDSKPD